VNVRHTSKKAIREIGALLPVALSCAVLLSACTNNFLTAGGGIDPNALRAPAAVSDQGDSSLVVSRIAKSAVDPSGSFDLIGDGTGTMSQYCFSETEGSAGESNCRCEYSFILPDGNSNSFDVATSYHDANMIRCRFADAPGIPASVSSVNVRILLSNSQTYSNTLRVKMTGTGTALDLSDPLSFTQAERYQCRDIVNVPYLFDGNIMDPVVSDDPKISYPLNFYTTNMGGSLALFVKQGSAVSNWNCPSIPNDSASDAGLDLTVYSLGPDETGSKQIFPAKSGFDRSTFYLARSNTGIFNVPVHAFTAPTITTGVNELPALGYGAAPVPTTNGETCPDTDPSVIIPSGYEWVKVWLFRANLAPREYQANAGLKTIGGIGCNPGKFPVSQEQIFPDCKDLPTMSDALNATGRPAARVLLGTGMCMSLRGEFPPCSANGRVDGPGCTSQSMTAQYPDKTMFAPGTDVWATSGNATPYSCGGSNATDLLNLCTEAFPVPHTTELTPKTMDQDGGRFDFLFVVTPPTVTTNTMKNLSSSASHAYIPYRYRPGDCASPDPDNPVTDGDCDGSKRITYGLKLHDVISNGDPPASNQNRAGVFPVCTIRPKGGS